MNNKRRLRLEAGKVMNSNISLAKKLNIIEELQLQFNHEIRV